MTKRHLLLAFLVPFINLANAQNKIEIDETLLLNTIQVLAHDSLEGRGFGTNGNKKARAFIADQFKSIGIAPAFATGFHQDFDTPLTGRRRQRMFPVDNPGNDFENVPDTVLMGGNVVAKILGKSDKVIAITGHLDHLGIRGGKIYNGADDDASGTAALLAIAKYFKNKNPNHTLIFGAVDGEEFGMPGSKYLVDNFPGGLDNVVLNVNMDMIAHNDVNELWAVGTFHYPDLKPVLKDFDTPISLLFGHDDPENKMQQNWTFSSDHGSFHKKQIPFIYFGVDDHKDYHKDTDIFENINQEFYVNAVKLIIEAIEKFDSSL